MSSACKEELLKVSADLMDNPLGFSIDAGGTLYKLVYRSKKDYLDGKPLKKMENGILRVVSIPVRDGFEKVLEWLLANADVAVTEELRDVVWLQSGINIKHHESAMQQHFNIKYDTVSEFALMGTLLKNFEKTDLKVLPADAQLLEEVCEWKRRTLECRKERFQQQKQASCSYLQELLEGGGEWLQKHLKHSGPIKKPSICIITGSLTFVCVLTEQCDMLVADVCPSTGKIFCAFAEEMFGEKDFEKFVQLVGEGDCSKVDLRHEELEGFCVSEDVAEDVVCSELGKMNLENSDYSRADVAAGVFSLLTHNVAKMAVLSALCFKVDSVYVAGTLSQSSVARRFLESHFYKEALSLPFKLNNCNQQTPLKIHFIEKPGYLVTLGGWIENCQRAQHHRDHKAL